MIGQFSKKDKTDMDQAPPQQVPKLASCSVLSVLCRRDGCIVSAMIIILMCIELMLNSVNLLLVASLSW
jgi:hypothetical protein